MINYGLIQEASEYYSDIGYPRIESPWLVTKEISDITRPPDASSYIVKKDNETKSKVFVASGEQSFLYLINKGFLPTQGKFHTITPCMRNDSFDDTHTKYFMKLELIQYDTAKFEGSIDKKIQLMAGHALDFFNNYAEDGKIDLIKIKDTDEFSSYDINMDGVEVGSYGYRECLFCNWIYGTGLAEPRFSRMLRR